MGLFSSAIGLGLDVLSASKKKKSIRKAAVAEQEQFQEGIDVSRAFDERTQESVSPFLSAGQKAPEALVDILLGEGRLTPTKGEDVATANALEAINQQASAGRTLLSGDRLLKSGEAAARIGSQFRGQDIAALLGLGGQGLQAAGIGAQAGATSTSNIIDLLKNIAGSKSGAILGRSQATQNLFGNVGEFFGSEFGGDKGGSDFLKALGIGT